MLIRYLLVSWACPMTRVCSCDLQKKLLENSLGFNYKFLDELKLHYALTLLRWPLKVLEQKSHIARTWPPVPANSWTSSVPGKLRGAVRRWRHCSASTWWLLLQLLGLQLDYLIDHPQSLFNLTAKWGWVHFCKSHTLPGNYLRLLQILGQALNHTAP